MSKIPKKQIIKSIIMTALGATPGVVWFFNVGSTQSIVIAGLGTLIGFGLSLPGVSAARVAGGTVGMIAANNVPRSMRDDVIDAFVGDKSAPEDSDEKEDSQEH